ncbi:MAG: phosphotransferase [Bdellovibrionota bacterium]|nr:phosphotransferase [Bdellovibrionota bacterium]
MGDYTKLQLTEAQAIADMYGIGQIKKLQSLSLGISNSNYKVECDQETYLLKVSNDKGQEELHGEMNILLYLNRLNFPYSLVPFKTTEGLSVYTYQDKFGVLFPFLDGIPPGPSDFTCEEIGRGLAKLHTLSHDDELKTLRDHECVGFGVHEIYDYAHSSAAPEDFRDLFNLMFPHKLEWFREQKWERGIIHGDLYYDNTLFKSEALQTLLDFEQGGRGEYLLDLGISISGTCLEKGRLHPNLIRSYLRGYEELRPLPREEKLHLADTIALGLFSIALWRIKRFKEKDLNPLMAESYRELLLRAEIFNETLKSEPLL